MSVPILFCGRDCPETALARMLCASDPGISVVKTFLFNDADQPLPLCQGSCDSYAAELAALLCEQESADLLVCGPLTVIAKTLLAYPQVKETIRRIIFAGGSFRSGNATVCAEKYVYEDPEAADIVLRSGLPIVLSLLETAEPMTLSEEEAQALPASCRSTEKPVFLNSTMAALSLLQPDLFETAELYVKTELAGEFCRGSLIADRRGQYGKEPNVTVLKCRDRSACVQKILELTSEQAKEVAA